MRFHSLRKALNGIMHCPTSLDQGAHKLHLSSTTIPTITLEVQVSETFKQRWGCTIEGCWELFDSTIRWRQQRNEKVLNFADLQRKRWGPPQCKPKKLLVMALYESYISMQTEKIQPKHRRLTLTSSRQLLFPHGKMSGILTPSASVASADGSNRSHSGHQSVVKRRN